MKFDDFFEACWKDLPPIRRGIAGRIATRRLFLDAVLEFDMEKATACKTADDYQNYEAELLGKIKKRAYGSGMYGFAIAGFILMAIASAIVQWIVLWWLNHITDRTSFAALQQEMAS